MINIYDYDKLSKEEIFAREKNDNDVSAIVSEIINEVKQNGDKALYYYSKKFDKADLSSLTVKEEEFEDALKIVEPKFVEVIRLAIKNITKFHKKQIRKGFCFREKGKILGQKITPIERVGLYVPGGTASYPSTVLMNAIPAQIAGCKKIAIATPANSEGKINPYVLATAKLVGINKVYKMGGAQAIGALTYGTESVEQVDKIVGPGNAFVAEAKRQVFGRVSIDMIAGPSEIMVIADENNNPKHVSADLLSQAEHDKMASAVLVTNSYDFAKMVQSEIEEQLKVLPRSEIARVSIDNNGKIIVAKDILDIVDIANEIAPEHLEIMVDNPFDFLNKIKNAGSIFLGKNCPEALGDYLAGSNHTLPTMGTAKFSSPLSVDDFIKKTQYIYYNKKSLNSVGESVALFAKKEGLMAHANSVLVRMENNNE